MPDLAGRAVDCKDVMGRSRQVEAGVSGDSVYVRTPPGETALMTWTAAEELRRLLAFAVAHVLRDETS